MNNINRFLAALISCALVFSMSLFGCTSNEHSSSDSSSSSSESSSSSSASASSAELEEQFLASSNSFAAKFATQTLSSATENSCISPLSLYYALSLLTAGSSGDAQAELLSLLSATDSDQLTKMCSHQLIELATEDENYKLTLANSIWVGKDYEFTDDFLDVANEDYEAESFNVEFGADETNEKMTKWVSDSTNGLLEPEFETTTEQIISIINAIYFKDAWVSQFDESATENSVFHAVEGDVETPFMNRLIEGCGYAQLENCTMVELYFTSGATMTFYLPNEGASPSSLLASEDASQALISAEPTNYENVRFSIPKFEVSSKLDDLVSTLKTLGVNEIFTNTSLDTFNPMLEYSGEGEQDPVCVSSIVQGSTITVDEEGVEAAAYTEVGISTTAAPSEDEPIEFTLDRPFLFKLTAPDYTTLFMGVVTNPAS